MDGTVESVRGSVVDVRFPVGQEPRPREALRLADEDLATLEVHSHPEPGLARALALVSTRGLRRGHGVTATGGPPMIPVGDELLGRVSDCLGRPLDGGLPIATEARLPIHRVPPALHLHAPETVPMYTGLEVIDLLCPFAKGGETGLFGGAGVGKTLLLMEFIGGGVEDYRGVPILAGVGERIREGHELWHEFSERGLMERTVMVFGQMDAPPGTPLRVPDAALSVAEHFRDDGGRDVLLLVDTIFRFVQAGMETSGLLGHIPSRVGCQPTLSTELGEVEAEIKRKPARRPPRSGRASSSRPGTTPRPRRRPPVPDQRHSRAVEPASRLMSDAAEELRAEVRARIVAAGGARQAGERQSEELEGLWRVLRQEQISGEVQEVVAARLATEPSPRSPQAVSARRESRGPSCPRRPGPPGSARDRP
ncbi:MAG: F0F1 ATP synthase subunit beta [Myxococcota bacterium]